MGSHPALVLAKVDVDSEGGRSLGERFGVEGFPTLKFLPPGGGDADDYDGDRTASAMQDFLESKVGPAGALPEMAEAVETFGACWLFTWMFAPPCPCDCVRWRSTRQHTLRSASAHPH